MLRSQARDFDLVVTQGQCTISDMSATEFIPSGHPNSQRICLPSPGTLLLGTLLLIVGAVSIPIGTRYQRQQELIEYIELQGGSVETDDSAPAWVHGLLARILGEERARGFGEIVGVNLASDEALPRLNAIRSIRSISIGRADPYIVGDIDLQPLRQLEDLEELCLVLNWDVNGDDMRDLSGLTNLRILVLTLTQVGDDGLPHLRRLTNLETLHLGDTPCSAGGVEELRRHLPDCEIHDGSLFGGRRWRNSH